MENETYILGYDVRRNGTFFTFPPRLLLYIFVLLPLPTPIAARFEQVPCLAYYPTLKNETIYSTETSVDF
jgi:hypothetical protein